jgi:hypothetical protein
MWRYRPGRPVNYQELSRRIYTTPDWNLPESHFCSLPVGRTKFARIEVTEGLATRLIYRAVLERSSHILNP